MKLLMLLIMLLTVSIQPHKDLQTRKISDSEVKAVTQAVEDEIYDYGYQKHYYHMGETASNPPNPPSARMRIYVDPEIDRKENGGRVIYKLMPYGEVIREFVFRKDGLAILSGDPQIGFPPTQESNTKTLYIDDDQLCEMKHDWLRRVFIVEDSPSAERIQDAARRQKARTGFSDWEYNHRSAHDRGK